MLNTKKNKENICTIKILAVSLYQQKETTTAPATNAVITKKQNIMKKETMLARLKKGGLLKKDGTYKSGVEHVLESLASGEKIHGRYSGRGRFAKYTAGELNLATAAACVLKLKTITGNDAPREGKIGYFVMLAPGEAKKLKNIIL